MVLHERGTVRDRDDRRARKPLAEQLVEARLGLLVETRRGLVEEDPIGLDQERARQRQALLLAARKELLPVLGLIESILERAQVDQSQHLANLVVREGAGRLWIGHDLAQGPDR